MYLGQYALDKLCMGGDSATRATIKELISGAYFTFTGGCADEPSNFRSLLGAQAPVIAQATDNLLSDEDASFEGGTVGGWTVPYKSTTSIDATQGYHELKCIKLTCSSGGTSQVSNNITAITALSTQYTLSARFKGVAGYGYKVALLGSNSGETLGATVVADGTWQTATVTKTFNGSDATRYATISGLVQTVGMVFMYDAIQLEAGAVATPFCIGSRDACSCSIACPFTAAPASLFFAVNEVWAGNDGVLHTLYDDDAISIYKSAANNLTLEVVDVAAGVKTIAGAVNASNMAANTTHFIAATIAADGSLVLKLNNVSLTSVGGAGTGIPANFNASSYFGTDTAGANFWDGAALASGFGRVLSAGEITALSSLAAWADLYNSLTLSMPLITSTGEAKAATVSPVVNIPMALATATGNAPALTPSPVVLVDLPIITATGEAKDASVTAATTVAMDTATATGEMVDPLLKIEAKVIEINLPTATATADALDATVTPDTTIALPAASATAEALDMTVTDRSFRGTPIEIDGTIYDEINPEGTV